MIEVYHLCCDKIMLVVNIQIDSFSPVCLFVSHEYDRDALGCLGCVIDAGL